MTTRHGEVVSHHRVVDMDTLLEIGDVKYIPYELCLHKDSTMQYNCLETSTLYCAGEGCLYNSCEEHAAQTIARGVYDKSAHIYTPVEIQEVHEFVAPLTATICNKAHPRYGWIQCALPTEAQCIECGWTGCLDCAMHDELHLEQACIILGYILPDASTQSVISEATKRNLSKVEQEHLDWITKRAAKAREESDATIARIMSKSEIERNR